MKKVMAMTFFANTKKLKSKYITFLVLYILPITLVSLTELWFQTFYQEGYGLMPIRPQSDLLSAKKVISLCLGTLGATNSLETK